MSVTTTELFRFDNSFVRELPGLYVEWKAATAPAPRLLVANDELAVELGLDAGTLHGPEALAVLAGNAVPSGATPVAMVYAGHQFGGYAPRLGDGRALLLGEVVDVHGRRRDIHLKGSGATPFARLKARLNASSESYPTRRAIAATPKSVECRRSRATCIRQPVR